jgi:lipoprotein-anchoring transpeptidase ErfK/SrfK
MASAAGGIAPPASNAPPAYDPAAPAPPYDPAAPAAPGAPDQFMTPPAAYPDPAAPQTAYPDAGAPPAESAPAGAAAPFAPVDTSNSPVLLGTTAPPGTDPADVHAQFVSTMTSVKQLLNQDRLADAHLELSRWHGDARLSDAERREVQDLLDQLAGTVVYSHESLVEPPYEVQQGETLQQVADRYQIPWQLLAKINGIADPAQVHPGEKLKVVRGPFSAVVDLNQKHMTLWIESRYAGSFPINVGRDQVAPPGTFEVKDKVENPIYYGPDQVIGADDPANPLGERWISLGQQLGIHGSNDPQGTARADERGCIRMSDRDIHDVYDILSVGSKVVIRR